MRSARLGGVALAAFSWGLLASCSVDSGGSGGSPYGGGGSGGNAGAGGTGGSVYPTDGSVSDQKSNPSDALVEFVVSDGPQYDPDAYWANDPPPPQCLDSGLTQPVPGGTPDCPDDKNREGCICPEAGKQAACWPGFRKNRNRGICHDGTTTCQKLGETQLQWGPCGGYQLPTATTGKNGCVCFSGGQWKIANLSPCFIDSGGGYGSGGAVSTIFDGKQGNCPAISDPITQPTQPWSEDSLKVDCAGHFKLCYTLKAGTASAPQPADCSLVKKCVEADYPTPNVDQKLPDIDSWLVTAPADVACAEKFATTGGYGEMSVLGLSVECDKVDDGSGGEKVFNRVQYCPMSCTSGSTDPACQNCQSGGSGQF